MRDTIKASVLGFLMFFLLGLAALYGMERQERALQAEAVKAMGVGK